jgi:glycosyltransferase involved in cell wall biosynthesis
MSTVNNPVRVLYSFPHKLGADRICYTAWHQVNGLAKAGAHVVACPGVLHKPVLSTVTVRPTLSWGRMRLPYRFFGPKRSCAIHDAIVARRLRRWAGEIDIIHTWPMGALRTLKAAADLGIPAVLERPNAHTRFAYEIVEDECRRLGLKMPPGHEHAFKEDCLQIEEEEYRRAGHLLCPSDFVAKTFTERGFSSERLARHQYGFDENTFFPPPSGRQENGGKFTMLFAGGLAPRKGLHYALKAWMASPAHREGEFLIAGEFIPGYREKLEPLLSHPSVKTLGFRRDVPELMRKSNVFVLPSIEEGSALVTSEARGAGCVLLVSDASGAICEHEKTGLIHRARDLKTLTDQLTAIWSDASLLARLRSDSLATAPEITWAAAGRVLLNLYISICAQKGRSSLSNTNKI